MTLFVIRTKPLIALTIVVILVRLFRHFIFAPYFSLASIGAARGRIGRAEDENGIMYADHAQHALFPAHDAWIIGDIVLDVILIAIVAVYLFSVRSAAPREPR